MSKRRKIILGFMTFFYVALIVVSLFTESKDKLIEVLPLVLIPVVGFIAYYVVIKTGIAKPIRINLAMIIFLVTIPLYSITFGKRNSQVIFENKNFDYSTKILPKTILKFIGKAGDHYIFTSLDNKKRYFFKSSDINLELSEFKSF